MEKFYSIEKNVQMLIYLLKAHGIRKVVASPGTTNITFVGSLQNDLDFEIYSAADERSACYIACGLAAETQEPVVITCTGATASRNYIPGLTEAFYRKLPILAVTATQHTGRIGQNIPQVIDRSVQIKDTVKYSLQLPVIHDEEDAWAYGVKINEALLELRHHGGGPVHINLTTQYSKEFSVKSLPPVKIIHRICYNDALPSIKGKKIAIFVGAHLAWNDSLTSAVDSFCETYNAVVFCDHSSNYQGKYRVFFSLVGSQALYQSKLNHVDLLIDIGDISGAYCVPVANEVWRVNPDGIVRDTYRKLTNVFEMQEKDFFQAYADDSREKNVEYYKDCCQEYKWIYQQIPELPFSNIWVAQHTCQKLPQNSVLHLGILNTLRSWNFFDTPLSIRNYVNTGGFGIDGDVSALVGASLADKDMLYFGVVGELAFFYDMNVLGNRHVGSNIRLMLINNGLGVEFRNYNHPANRFGEDADAYMAAAGHYGNKSADLVRHYATDLGFEYLSASNKEEFEKHISHFLTQQKLDKPILFEIFTNKQDESDALYQINHLITSKKEETKQLARNILGEKGIKLAKKFLRR